VDAAELRVLLATRSPVVESFFVELARAASPPMPLDRVPLDAGTLERSWGAVALATVAVVDTDAAVDLPAASAVCQVLRTRRPDLPILGLVYAVQAVAPWHVEVLLAGDLAGLLDLRTTAAEVLAILPRIALGRVVIYVQLDREHGAALRDALLRHPLALLRPVVDPRAYGLTTRESEVLQFLIGGASDKEVAAHMGLSHSTVRGYVRSILAKLGGRTRVELGLIVTRLGLTSN